jgi:hypothetical protein
MRSCAFLSVDLAMFFPSGQNQFVLLHAVWCAVCRAVPCQVCWVPGCFELPVVAKSMAKSGKFDAVVCIGVVVSSSHTAAVLAAYVLVKKNQ